MLLRPGDLFGRYRVEQMLGEGGMGTVYQAFDTALHRRVALKLVKDDGSADAPSLKRARERLLREARAAAGIEHRNAVLVHDVGEVEETMYIAMELVEGRSLRAYVGDASVPHGRRIGWLVDVAHALAAAHAQGLVHRDVKPENVLVRTDGTVKVLDFGIASLSMVGEEEGPFLQSMGHEMDTGGASVTSRFAGTPRYMAPEQLRGDACDARADQYAWGVLAYELLSGRAPLGADAGTLTGLADLQEQEAAPLREVAPRVSGRVERVVHRALEKEPERRYSSMKELVEALRGEERRGTMGRRIPALVAGAGAVVASIALVGTRRHPAASGHDPRPVGSTSSAATSAPEDPPTIVLMLDATKGVDRVGEVVHTWHDQSGNGNDAIAGHPAPTFVEKAGREFSAIHFDGGSHMTIADSPSLQLADEDFTVEVVARHTRPEATGLMSGYGSTTGYGLLYCKTLVERPFKGVGLFVNFPFPTPGTRFGAQTSYDDNAISTSEHLNDGRFHLFGFRRDGGTLEVRVDGVAESRVPRPRDDVSAAGRPAFLGAQPQPNGIIQQLEGDIAAVVVVRYPIAPRYFAELERELRSRFGI